MATIFDVAKLAGVSIKTVSRVVNEETGVRAGTRTKVQAAIDKLDYRPHSGARLMRSGKSGLIGLVTSALSTISRQPASSGLSSIHIVKGVQQVCREEGKTLLIVDSGGDGDMEQLIKTLEAHRVEGIVCVLDHHRFIPLPVEVSTPLWVVNGFGSPDIPAVVPDDFDGQYQAVKYLLRCGHQRLAYVGLPYELEAGRLRRDGFVAAARQQGLPDQAFTTTVGASLEKDQFVRLGLELEHLFQQAQPPTAICFGNDLMALRAKSLLEQMGLRIPEDVSIMGYDNDIAIAEALHPQLTTVSLPYQRMGRRVARELLQQLVSPNAESEHVYPLKVQGEVIERRSVTDLLSI